MKTPFGTLLGSLIVLGSLPALSANRCVDAQGKVTYQDAACASGASAGAIDTTDAFTTRPKAITTPRLAAASAAALDGVRGSSDYATYRGAWRGPSQFELSSNGVRDQEAHYLTPLVLEIRPDGEVAGVISGAGCRFSGLATQGVAPYLASLDVSLQGCSDKRFNTRYSGSFTAITSSREATLHLVALTVKRAALSVTTEQLSLSAVLKR